jgi:hypothetical protein
MGRLQATGDKTPFAQKALLDGVGRDENVRRLGLEMVVGGPKEPEALFRDFEVAGPNLGCGAVRVTHNLRAY